MWGLECVSWCNVTPAEGYWMTDITHRLTQYLCLSHRHTLPTVWSLLTYHHQTWAKQRTTHCSLSYIEGVHNLPIWHFLVANSSSVSPSVSVVFHSLLGHGYRPLQTSKDSCNEELEQSYIATENEMKSYLINLKILTERMIWLDPLHCPSTGARQKVVSGVSNWW